MISEVKDGLSQERKLTARRVRRGGRTSGAPSATLQSWYTRMDGLGGASTTGGQDTMILMGKEEDLLGGTCSCGARIGGVRMA